MSNLDDDDLSFTAEEVAVPRGSSGLAKRFLEAFYDQRSLQNLSQNSTGRSRTPVAPKLSRARGGVTIGKVMLEKIVGEPGTLLNPDDQLEDPASHLETDSVEEVDKEDQKDPQVDRAKKYLEELNEVLPRVPIFSLGKPNPVDFRSVPDDTRDEIMLNYPSIPVRKIHDLDIYLIAYENFLTRWQPTLKFNYTDPGKIEGHLNSLKNAIKLAFYDQYSIVRKAYLDVRTQIFTDLNLPLPSTSSTSATSATSSHDLSGSGLRPAHLLLEENRVTPALFDGMIDQVFASLKDKEILDISGHRGSGYFLLWASKDALDPNHAEADHQLYALPTIGTFGHFLPEPGFSLVKEHGWPYFRNTEIIGFQIGHLRKILIENRDGDWEDWELKGPIYLEVSESEYDDHSVSRIQVDGHFFQGTVYSTIE